MAFPIIVTAGTAVFLRMTKTGTAMRALRQRPRDHRHARRARAPRRGRGVVRLGCHLWHRPGCCCRNLVGLDIVTLTFFVIAALAAALIGQLRSLWLTLVARLRHRHRAVVPHRAEHGVVDRYRTMTPFVLAIIAILWMARKRQVVVQT